MVSNSRSEAWRPDRFSEIAGLCAGGATWRLHLSALKPTLQRTTKLGFAESFSSPYKNLFLAEPVRTGLITAATSALMRIARKAFRERDLVYSTYHSE